MATINIRVVVLREGDTWVAQALEYDIGAQASDLKALQRRFTMTVQAELDESVRRTGVPFGGIEAAPAYFHDMWEGGSAKFMASGTTSPSHQGVPPVGYEMLLAA